MDALAAVAVVSFGRAEPHKMQTIFLPKLCVLHAGTVQIQSPLRKALGGGSGGGGAEPKADALVRRPSVIVSPYGVAWLELDVNDDR